MENKSSKNMDKNKGSENVEFAEEMNMDKNKNANKNK